MRELIHKLIRLLPYMVYVRLIIIKQNISFNLEVIKVIISGRRIFNKNIYPALFSNIDHAWEFYEANIMKKNLDKIYEDISIEEIKFESALEFGCGKPHFTDMLKKQCQFLYGVDIIEKKLISNSIDKYIRCSINIQDTYLDEISSNSLDCIFILHVSGYGSNKVKNSYTSFDNILNDKANRTGRYFKDFNRILKKNGFIFIIEWQIYTHDNFKEKTTLDEANNNLDNYYNIPQLENFTVISSGLKPDMTGPYLALKKISS